VNLIGSRWAWRCGAVLQGTVLGVLLLKAIIQLLLVNTGVHLFRYQGF
jgi:hypothetical protein